MAEERGGREAQYLHQVLRQREECLLLRRRGFAARMSRPREIADQHDAEGSNVLTLAVPDHVGEFVALVD